MSTFAERLCVVALGVTDDGTKVPLGLVKGATENTTVVTGLLEDLRDRELDVTRHCLSPSTGPKALRSAVCRIFDKPVIARCQLRKIRNVEDHLPEGQPGGQVIEAADVLGTMSSPRDLRRRARVGAGDPRNVSLEERADLAQVQGPATSAASPWS